MRSASQRFVQANEVRLVRSGSDYFDCLRQLIDQATDNIHLQTYIFADDETGTMISNALIEASKRGVRVYMVVDGYASQEIPTDFINRLTSAGIYFRWFDPLLKSKYFYLGRRLHHKVFVADGLHGLVGGINVSDHYNDTTDSIAWKDYAVYVSGDIASELKLACERRTVLANTLDKKPGSQFFSDGHHSVSPSDCLVGVRINDWVRRRNEITKSYLQMLAIAKSHVMLMSPYFIPGRKFLRSLIQAANRGVKIQLILTGISDVPVAKFAERYMYNRLFMKNLDIYEYQKTVLHGKLSVCDDDWVTIGSYNINNISAYASVELNLEIKNKRFANQVNRELADVIKSDCKLISETEHISHLNIFRRLLYRGAYDVFRVLFFLFTFYFKQHRE
ncbi:MAG TPA: cardiolipin synthase ClsB [Cyclobacteriaceae bacterium]|nr:cardiolipin synthase ClsB [Cyclobacteriaceae bacterium]